MGLREAMLKGVTAGPLACQVVLCGDELDEITGVLDGFGNAYGFDFRADNSHKSGKCEPGLLRRVDARLAWLASGAVPFW